MPVNAISNIVNTPLALQFGYIDEKNEMKSIGHTSVSTALELPAQEHLVVTPRQAMTETDWEQLIALMRDHHITGLNAAGRLTDDALGKLTALDFVTYLFLDGSRQITDAGILQLAAMPQMQHLEIGCWECGITDRGLQVLKELNALKTFKMCWQQGISDEGTSNLRYCGQLESVNLMGTPTGDETLGALADKPSLKKLRTGKTVTDKGLAMLQDFPVFKSWKGGEPETAMLSAEAGPNFLMIDGPFTDKGLASMKGLDGLFGFSIFWHSKLFSAEGIRNIAQLPELGFLGLESEHCNDDAMEHIGKMPKLRMLMAQGAVASDRGFEGLSQSKSLENIWGRDFANLYNAGFRSLSKIPTLRGLAVNCKNVDDEALSMLPHFPALKQITPIGVRDEGFRYIGQCKQIEALICMYCRDTTDVATAYISGLANLKRYYAGMTQIGDKSLELLSGLRSLEEIELFKCLNITNAGIPSLGNLPNLKKLELGAMPQIDPASTSFLTPKVAVDYWT